MLNTVALVGNLGQDPELRYFQNGTAYANARIAVNDYYNDGQGNKQQKTYWIPCTFVGKTAEILAQYCSKGSRIGVTGKLTSREWEDQSGGKRSVVEVKVDNLEFLSRLDSNGSGQNHQSHDNGTGAGSSNRRNNQNPPPPPPPEPDDDIPF